MGTTILVGTVKGLAVLRSNSERRSWEMGPLQHKGWVVSAAARDSAGRFSLGLSHEVYGATIQQSENLEDWDAVESMPQIGV